MVRKLSSEQEWQVLPTARIAGEAVTVCWHGTKLKRAVSTTALLFCSILFSVFVTAKEKIEEGERRRMDDVGDVGPRAAEPGSQ